MYKCGQGVIARELQSTFITTTPGKNCCTTRSVCDEGGGGGRRRSGRWSGGGGGGGRFNAKAGGFIPRERGVETDSVSVNVF